MSKPQLVVMAAGIGSRYGGLKQIDPVGPGGEIVLDYAVYDAIKAGFGKVVFIIRQEIADAFREKVGRSIEKRIETAYVMQELDRLPDGFALPCERQKPWGTGHAVLCAREAVSAPFAVINADDFYGAGSYAALGEYLRGAEDTGPVGDYCMVGYRLDNTLSEHGHVARGVCTATDDGMLASVVERTKIQRFDDGVKYSLDDGDTWIDIAADSTVSLNMWGFTPSLFDYLEAGLGEFLHENINTPKAEYFLPSVVNQLIQDGKAGAKVLGTDERWYGVTYQEDKPALKAVIAGKIEAGLYPPKLWE